MKVNCKWLSVLLLFAALPLAGCNFVQKLNARDSLNKGVKAFTDQKYDAAAQFFEKAVQMDPELLDARMYLAHAHAAQFVPGSTDPKSEENARKAIESFALVADMAAAQSDEKKNAMLSIASLYYQLKQYKESKEWCVKIFNAFPQTAEAYYRIAVMNFDDVLEKTGIQGENVEYMSPEEKTTALANIEEGLLNLDSALKIRPNYFDAMEYQNLLWREKAKFETDEAKKSEYLKQAGLVSQKALALRLKAQQEDAKLPKKLGKIGGSER
jgi:tetratricopeptide (TPR) repeat protein